MDEQGNVVGGMGMVRSEVAKVEEQEALLDRPYHVIHHGDGFGLQDGVAPRASQGNDADVGDHGNADPSSCGGSSSNMSSQQESVASPISKAKLAPFTPGVARSSYTIPEVSLTKAEMARLCKHFRHRTDKFKGVSKDSPATREVQLSLKEYAKLSRHRRRQGIIWKFVPLVDFENEEDEIMAWAKSAEFEKLQRKIVRGWLALRRLKALPYDSDDASLSEDNGQYDSEDESDGSANSTGDENTATLNGSPVGAQGRPASAGKDLSLPRMAE
ncbi:hypothetical protein VTL71DRAFT_14874 [Oculimacula yallundae]|uniref:Uncharacterized protein n=1 Tax=Oculimacula yallundae TaxID=86028 RepID=A0ABR4CG85_9HELO